MMSLPRAISAHLQASLSTMLQYRGELILWAIWGVVYPAVAMAMWAAAVKGAPGGEQIQGMDARDFAAYFLLTMITGHVVAAWDIFEMGYLVRTGAMSPRLLQPILPIWQSLSDNLAYKIFTLILLIPIWIGVAYAAHPRFSTTTPEVIAGIFAIVMAAAIHYLWNYNLALAAFWVTRMDSITEMWWGMNLLLGGRVAPLTLMPLPLRWIANLLPFQWIIWFPSATVAGQLDFNGIVTGLLFQVGWFVGGLIAFQIIWRLAIRRYSAVGA